MKRLILILTIIFTFTLNAAYAAVNYLNEVVLEGSENGYNVILRSDMSTKVKKAVISNDKIVLTLKGVTVSDNVSTLYKNTNGVNNIIVENVPTDGIKVYINAQNIANANIILNTPNSAPIPIGDKFAREKLLWAAFSIGFLLLLIHYIKSQNRRIIKRITMREREIAFYKANLPSMNYKMAQQAYAMNSRTNFPKTIRQYQEK